MAIHLETPADEYHRWPRFSAGMGWHIVGPDGCLALCWHNSAWLNPNYVPVVDEVMENGTMAHLACLQQHLLDAAIVIIDATSYRSKAAQLRRDEAYAAGKYPILYDREPGSKGPSFQKLLAMRQAIENSVAAPLIFTEGLCEVSFDWDYQGTPCKARADRVTTLGGRYMVDLKTAPSASPEYFQRAMVNYGHHMRAAFYLYGWECQDDADTVEDYLFVVVQREPPHLVSVYRLDDAALEWGDKLWRKAIKEFKVAHATDKWPAYTTAEPQQVSLPVWAWHRLADQEAAGQL